MDIYIYIGTRDRISLRKTIGTMFYMAPEVINQQYSFHCDMWSVGVILFVMTFGFPPFHGAQNRAIQRKILNGFNPTVKKGWGAFFPDQIPVSQNLRDLIRRLLELDPTLRLTATEVLEHPWIASASENNTDPLVGMLRNLSNFTVNIRFKSVVLRALSSALDEKDATDLRNMFKRMDTNGDGILSQDELELAMGNATTREEKSTIQTLMDIGEDTDSDGLSYHELVMASLAKKLASKDDRMFNIFTALDQNGDGKLCRADISMCLSEFINKGDDVDDLIREVNNNNNNNNHNH